MVNNSLPKLDEEFAKAQAQFPQKTAADMRTEYNSYLGHPYMKHYDEIVKPSNLKAPDFKDLSYYADNFGIDTSVANLQNKFDEATRREYALKNAEYRASEDAYYQNMAAQQAQYADAANGAISQALANGASRGMQFANQFAAQNAIAEQGSTGALDLATQRNNLKGQEAEAYAQNAINAEQTAYDRKANILGQAVANYANEVQRYAADATLEGIDRQLRTQNYQFNMTQQLEQHLAEQGYSLEQIKSFVDMYTSMFNTFGNMWGNKVTADATVRAAAAGRYSGNNPTEEQATYQDIYDTYAKALVDGEQATVQGLLNAYPWLANVGSEESIIAAHTAVTNRASQRNPKGTAVDPALTKIKNRKLAKQLDNLTGSRR